MRLDVYHHVAGDIGFQAKIFQLLEEIMGKLDVLAAEVAENTEVDASAIALIEGIAAQLEEMKNDPVAIQALADELNASSEALAAKVLAHTPAEPPAP